MRRAAGLAIITLAALPTVAPGASRPLAGKVIVIDPGHNGGNASHPDTVARLVTAGPLRKPCDTSGAATASGLSEPAYTWDVARRLGHVLQAAGAKVIYTRRGNDGVGPCITERAAVGNRAHADVAISIHADGGPPGGRGFHVIAPTRMRGYTDDIYDESRRLAYIMRRAYRGGTGIRYADYVAGGDGIDFRGDLGGLVLSDVPKVFVETGNMRNARDAAILERPRSRARIARAIARGLRTFLKHR